MQLSLIKVTPSQHKPLLFLVLFFLFLPLFPQSALALNSSFDENLKFEHITAADGLSQSYVFDLVQDSDGYIWIATQDGLNKYDGMTFKYYRSNVLDQHSVADNYIRKLFINSKGELWVGTANGLSKYNKALDNFTNYYFDEHDTNTLSDNLIWDIYEDKAASLSQSKNNNLWISTEKGLHKFDTQNKRFNRITINKPYRSPDLVTKDIKNIFQDSNGNYWFSTYANGFFITNRNITLNNSLNKQIQSEIGNQTTLINKLIIIDNEFWLATNTGVYVLNDNYRLKEKYLLTDLTDETILARNIIIANDSHIWVATEQGLKSINPLEGTFKSHNFNNVVVQEYNNYLYGLLIDSSDRLWLGSLNGVLTHNPVVNLINENHHQNSFANTNITSFITINDDVWFSSENESDIFKIQNSKVITRLDLELKGNITRLKSSDNNLLIFTDNNRLYKYKIEENELLEQKEWRANSNHDVSSGIFYYENKIWFLKENGNIACYDLITNKLTLPISDLQKFTSILLSQDNMFWLTTNNNQLFQLNPSSNKLAEFHFTNDSNYLIKNTKSISASKNSIALGSYNQGVLLIDKVNKISKQYNEDNLLSNNFIADIALDENNNFWVSTNKGISVITEKGNINSYYQDFSINDIEYLTQSSHVDKQGNIYFGGNNGFHYFSPEELLNSKQYMNKPVLSNLLIANKKIKVSNKKTPNQYSLPGQINTLDSITLNFSHSPFSLEFVSPNAKLPNQVAYRYKLHGLDENWIETDVNNLRATYTNLNAGDYIFEVQTYDLYEPRILKAKTINISILPPWWLSNSAVLMYSLISLLIIAYLLQQFRHKRLYHLQIKASEERLKLSLWGSGDEMWDWNIKKGKIYRSNIWGILDFPQDGKRNLSQEQDKKTNINENDISRITDALNAHLVNKTEYFEATYRVKDTNDQWIWVLDRGKVVERDENSIPTRMTGTLKDISDIKKADERLKLFAKCIENITDAVVIYDRKYQIVDVNKSFRRITGKTKADMIGKSLNFSRYPDSFTTNVKNHLANKGSWHGEIESKRDNGEVYLTDLNIDIIRDENQHISHFVGVFSDITKRKETEGELIKLANSDTLTGLPNRSYFQANQVRLVNKRIPHALLVFDLDKFRKVNDSMGHEVGDLLLCKMAERIRNVGRKQDTVYRLGGDEFSIIIENTNDIHTITTIAKNILGTIAEPIKLKNQELVLTSSIGIVLYPEDGTSPPDLLKNAGTAMYHAKNVGGDQYQFFNGAMNKKAVKRLQTEVLIRHGLKEDFFSVFYQPKIEIATGKVAGMEALVRFETPSKGIISPLDFIPVSEETGQIIGIGEVVLRKACFATKTWIDEGLFDGRIAVNLSAVQFTQPNLVEMIVDILKESRLPAKHLELEITEGTVMDSPQAAINTMLQIRDLGIHLSLDDFGTGYSSLAYLKKFPLNTLKIDKAFVDDIETSDQGRNMVATIVTIAHNLGLQVVAEGVETNKQLDFLSGLHCEQLQGFLYSKPLPQQDFKRYLLAHQITDKSTSFK